MKEKAGSNAGVRKELEIYPRTVRESIGMDDKEEEQKVTQFSIPRYLSSLGR